MVLLGSCLKLKYYYTLLSKTKTPKSLLVGILRYYTVLYIGIYRSTRVPILINCNRRDVTNTIYNKT